MAFKHKTDSVHYHDTVAEARECEESIFALCEHGMSADLCDGPQHYPYDKDEAMAHAWDLAPAPKPMTEQQKWEAGEPVMTRFQGSLPTSDGMWYRAPHDSPCVCGVYDRCSQVRRANALDSGNWRDRFRAYND